MQESLASSDRVEAQVETKELAGLIEEFLDTLSTENRVLFMRRYWFFDSYKQIADFAAISEKNVSVRLTRIRKKLKEYLTEKGVI